MKFRYIVFYFLAGWILVILISAILEKQAIGLIAKDVNSTVSLAAEMAINTVQASDEFFKGSKDVGAYDIYVPYISGGKDVGYKRANLYTEMAEKIWGVDISKGGVSTDLGTISFTAQSNADKNIEKIYQFMYGTGQQSALGMSGNLTEFFKYYSYVGNTLNKDTQIPLTNIAYLEGKDGNYELKYGVMPLIMRMGADTLYNVAGLAEGGAVLHYFKQSGNSNSVSLNQLYSSSNSAYDCLKELDTVAFTMGKVNAKKGSSPISEFIRVALANGFRTSKKESAIYGGGSYFVTPLSLGLTYLDNDLLSYCFINNMDLLMRTKYIDRSTTSAGKLQTMTFTEKGAGQGLPAELGLNQYTTVQQEAIIKNYNVINNGNFALVKGKYDSYGDFKSSMKETTSTEITYMIIDMYNNTGDAEQKKATETILKQIFSAYKGGKIGDKAASSVGEQSSVSNYLKAISTDTDTITGAPLEHKYIVVAKIDFYADIIVPYTSSVFRDFALRYDSKTNLEGTAIRSHGTYNDITGAGQVADNNFLNIGYTERKGTVGERISDVTGNTMYHYTTYFAVAP